MTNSEASSQIQPIGNQPQTRKCSSGRDRKRMSTVYLQIHVRWSLLRLLHLLHLHIYSTFSLLCTVCPLQHSSLLLSLPPSTPPLFGCLNNNNIKKENSLPHWLSLTQLPQRFHCKDELLLSGAVVFFKNSNSMTSAWETSACGFVFFLGFVCFCFFNRIQNQKTQKRRETRVNDVSSSCHLPSCACVFFWSYSHYFFFTLWLASSIHPMSFICWLV